MKLTEIFKPTTGKILLFLILMIGSNYLIISNTYILDARILVGVPLGFWPVGSQYVWPGTQITDYKAVEFSPINFIIDIIFWYFVSCMIILLYTKIKSNYRKS